MSLKRKRLLAAVALTASALLGSEVFARFYLGLGTPPLYVTHPRIEYMFKPGQDVLRFDNHFVVNRYGMRTGDFPATKAPGELRMPVFGDSVIHGGNLTDQDELAWRSSRGILHAASTPRSPSVAFRPGARVRATG